MRQSILKLNWKRTFPHVIVKTSNLVILCRKVLAEIRDNKTSADYVYFFSFNQMIYVAFSLPWPSSFLINSALRSSFPNDGKEMY